MNDLHYDAIPPNANDRVERGDPIPAELEEVDTDKEFRFYLYDFVKNGRKEAKGPSLM